MGAVLSNVDHNSVALNRDYGEDFGSVMARKRQHTGNLIALKPQSPLEYVLQRLLALIPAD